MATYKIDEGVFDKNYMTVVQSQAKLADTTNMWIEAGRGTGKTTHILASRIDRVQADLSGAMLVLVAATYKSIFENILSALMEYFRENYVEDMYYCIGKKPPKHFKQCDTYIKNWLHTISFSNGCVIVFASVDRPESMLGKNTPHIFVDEMLRIPEDKFTERILPALRANRSLYGHSVYFGGITGTSSTPNFETDYDWFIHNQKLMNPVLINCIQNMAYEIDKRLYYKERFKKELQQAIDPELIKKLSDKCQQIEAYIDRWTPRLQMLRRNQTFYLRVSSFSNIKILGLDYIRTQQKSTKDPAKFNASILSIRSRKPKELFAGKFGKQHLYQDSYKYDHIDKLSAGSYNDAEINKAKHLKHYSPNLPLYAGFDPGPFMSIVFGQRFDRTTNSRTRKFRVLKDMHVIHPDQQEELAFMINDYFKDHRRKEIFLHYDRAANQQDPHYRKFYPNAGVTDLNDTDAILLKKALEKFGWSVRLMSLNQGIIYYGQHYALLNILFGKTDGRRDEVMIDENEAPCLVSSIQSSPLKRHEGRIMLDKSSERELNYEDQAMWSTQIFTALLYLLWGEYKQLLPQSGKGEIPII